MRVVSDWMVGDFPGLFTPPSAGLSPTGGRVSSRGLRARSAFSFSFERTGVRGPRPFLGFDKPCHQTYREGPPGERQRAGDPMSRKPCQRIVCLGGCQGLRNRGFPFVCMGLNPVSDPLSKRGC